MGLMKRLLYNSSGGRIPGMGSLSGSWSSGKIGQSFRPLRGAFAKSFHTAEGNGRLMMFFDTTAVMNAVNKASRANLAQSAAYVRRTAKRLMRPKMGASRPGNPPHVHQGALKDLLFFGYDPDSMTAYVGPAYIRQNPNWPVAFSVPVPAVHEFGAVGVSRRKHSYRYGGKRVSVPAGRSMLYPARPYMKPAMDKTIATGKFSTVWFNSVRAA